MGPRPAVVMSLLGFGLVSNMVGFDAASTSNSTTSPALARSAIRKVWFCGCTPRSGAQVPSGRSAQMRPSAWNPGSMNVNPMFTIASTGRPSNSGGMVARSLNHAVLHGRPQAEPGSIGVNSAARASSTGTGSPGRPASSEGTSHTSMSNGTVGAHTTGRMSWRRTRARRRSMMSRSRYTAQPQLSGVVICRVSMFCMALADMSK